MARVRVCIIEIVEDNIDPNDGSRNDWWTVERVQQTGDPYTDCQNMYPPYFYTALGKAAKKDHLEVGDVILVQEEDLS